MAWWLWIVLGLITLAVEMFIPLDFFLFFIGVAGVGTGIIVGICKAMGFDVACSTGYFMFAVGALSLCMFARRPLRNYLTAKKRLIFSKISGEVVTITDADIAPSALGKGKNSGANWQVRNMTDSPLIVGKSYPVSSHDGIILVISKQK